MFNCCRSPNEAAGRFVSMHALGEKSGFLPSAMSKCRICPRQCEVDRRVARGYCGAGAHLTINLWQRHLGEEPVISGTRGSGTIFFSHCNLRCVYCQNFKISQYGWGKEYSVAELANIMLGLQRDGVHNINLVTPTHFTPQIRKAIIAARDQGLHLPVVWNSSAYEHPETLQTLEGLVDIYLPDFRYLDRDAALLYSLAPDYPERAMGAILEMRRQVGRLRLDADGLAERGLLCRILVLPENVNRADKILGWIAENLGTETYISLMAQYYPVHRAAFYPPLHRPITREEYQYCLDFLDEFGFGKGFLQEPVITPEWTPDFQPSSRLGNREYVHEP